MISETCRSLIAAAARREQSAVAGTVTDTSCAERENLSN
jgi:hypothetical protein